ncbi:inositol monophosphatase [Candidatus Woesearchaeota archaeon]|nr:inositol monophosphatase [Candidatus Woesearchaeota archaeon]
MKVFAIETAKLAGHYLVTNFRNDKTLLKERGSSKEIVTKYDKESDRIIVDMIRKQFPEHNILAEESGSINNNSEYTWIVDSLDGSGNFANGNPYFSVSIALMQNDEIILGVVYAPFLHELYVAEKGKGATLNGEPITVSIIADLVHAYVVTCEGSDKGHVRMAKAYAAMVPKTKDYRKVGSAALECCMVACGRADAYVTFAIDPWDVAAGILIAEEAGATVSDHKNGPWKSQRMDVVVTNGKVHKEFLSHL